MVTKVVDPFPVISDLDGTPLESGYVYIGDPGLNAEAFPKAAFWDEGLTTPATQPVRTLAGRFVDLGAQIGSLYVDGDYSIIIKDVNMVTVLSAENSADPENVLFFTDRAAFVSYASAVQPAFGAVAYAGVAGSSDLLAWKYNGTSTEMPEPELDGWFAISDAGFITSEQFGAVGDGVADDTAAWTAALATRQNIRALGKRYRITDRLAIDRQSVIGSGFDFPPFAVSSASSISGTVFICDFLPATADALFQLGRYAVFKDCCLYFPDQDAVRPANWTPVTTPWAIIAGSWDDTIPDSSMEVDNITLLEFTHGVRCRNCERSVFTNIKGNPFTVGLEADGIYDVIRFENFHWWPYGGDAGEWQRNEREWTLNNGTAYRFGRVDGLVLNNPFTIGMGVALEFYPSTRTGTNLGEACTNFLVSNAYLDGANTALKVSGTFKAGWYVGGTIASAVLFHWGTPTNDEIVTNRPTVDIQSPFSILRMNGVSLSAAATKRSGSHVEVNASRGLLAFSGSSAVAWDDDGAGAQGFVQLGGGSRIDLGNMQFLNSNSSAWDGTGRTLYTGDVTINAGNVSFEPTRSPRLFYETDGTGLQRLTNYDAAGSWQTVYRRARGTQSAPTAVQATDTLGGQVYQGYDGSGFFQAVISRARARLNAVTGIVAGVWEVTITTAAGTLVKALEVTDTVTTVPKLVSTGRLVGRINLGSSTLTISGGSVTMPAGVSYATIDTQGGAATDDLTDIVGGVAGDMIFIQSENAARVVVIKDDAGTGTSNIMCTGSVDLPLNHQHDKCQLIHDGIRWYANLWDVT